MLIEKSCVPAIFFSKCVGDGKFLNSRYIFIVRACSQPLHLGFWAMNVLVEKTHLLVQFLCNLCSDKLTVH